MAITISNKHQAMRLALARARYDVALAGLAHVGGDLVCDLRPHGTVAHKNVAVVLDVTATRAEQLVRRMQQAAAVISSIEVEMGLNNSALHISPAIAFEARAQVVMEWGVAEGKVTL